MVEKINELAASVLLVELRDKQLSDSENLVEKLKAAVVDLEASMARIELDLAERNTKIMLLQVTYPLFPPLLQRLSLQYISLVFLRNTSLTCNSLLWLLWTFL